jgi:hypothetical protein
MKIFFATLITSTFLFTASGYAQVREVGLRTNGFSDLGMIYKRQISENTYRRYRAAVGNLSANVEGSSTLFSLYAGGAYGKEKRRGLTEKLQAVYGTEIIATMSVTSGSIASTTSPGARYNVVSPTIGVALVLGAQYNFSPRWYVSTELLPSLTVGGLFTEGTSRYSVNAGFNSSNVGITGAYWF